MRSLLCLQLWRFWKAGNHSASRRGFLRLSRVLPTSRVFTSGYVNTETILHFFNFRLFLVGIDAKNDEDLFLV